MFRRYTFHFLFYFLLFLSFCETALKITDHVSCCYALQIIQRRATSYFSRTKRPIPGQQNVWEISYWLGNFFFHFSFVILPVWSFFFTIGRYPVRFLKKTNYHVRKVSSVSGPCYRALLGSPREWQPVKKEKSLPPCLLHAAHQRATTHETLYKYHTYAL